MKIKGKYGFSDMSILLVVGAVIVLLTMSIFFGNLGNKGNVGNAQKILDAQLLLIKVTGSDTDTKTEKPCGDKPKAPECKEYKNFKCVDGAWTYDTSDKADNSGCSAGPGKAGICCSGSCSGQPDNANCGSCGHDCSKVACSTGTCINDLATGSYKCEPKPDTKGDCKKCNTATGADQYDSGDAPTGKMCCLGTTNNIFTCDATTAGVPTENTCSSSMTKEQCGTNSCNKICFAKDKGTGHNSDCKYCTSSQNCKTSGGVWTKPKAECITTAAATSSSSTAVATTSYATTTYTTKTTAYVTTMPAR